MSAEQFSIVVVGSGPAGLSAAARAAQRGVKHVLLEKADHLADTIFKYQKGKYVMATPDVLPLRSDLDFEAAVREGVLGTWQDQAEALGVNIRLGAEVTAIEGSRGGFTLTLGDGSQVLAEHVVLSIGLQGNLRRLQVPGAEWDGVQYQLDDPSECVDESIVVIGAGDAAIENAVALAEQNRVYIVNRRDEFARAKDGNLSLILDAISAGRIECFYEASPTRVEPGKLFLETRLGEAEVACDRVIARLGAIPPRRFVESCGVAFPSEDRSALPEVSATYESNVPGLHIVGALAGYPLIKQAMNQGYEVVEYILGNDLRPADEPILEKKLEALPGTTVDAFLEHARESVPILGDLSPLVLRELMLDSQVHACRPGDVVFRRNDYTNSFFSIVSGQVAVELDEHDPSRIATLGAGEFFGEMGLISGRRRSATVRAHEDCVLIETGRRTMLKLLQSFEPMKQRLDRTALTRQLRAYLAASVPQALLDDLAASAEIKTWKANQALFEEGDEGKSMHLIRRGSVSVSRSIGGREVVLSYLAAGNYVGEMALLRETPRSATVRASVNGTETVRLDRDALMQLLDRAPELRASIEKVARDRDMQNVRSEHAPEAGNIVQFLIDQGVGEATDVLLINESLCIGCDNCEKACAETHAGTCRLDREAGPTYANVHVPTSCRHCEHPHCMKDCPPDAIHRAPNGEVFIDDSCIGCANCERNCPYGVIQMAPAEPRTKPGLLSWLLFGRGPGPGADTSSSARTDKKIAVKCDMCKDVDGGPACVRSCPTGAAARVSPEQFFEQLVRRS